MAFFLDFEREWIYEFVRWNSGRSLSKLDLNNNELEIWRVPFNDLTATSEFKGL